MDYVNWNEVQNRVKEKVAAKNKEFIDRTCKELTPWFKQRLEERGVVYYNEALDKLWEIAEKLGYEVPFKYDDGTSGWLKKVD